MPKRKSSKVAPQGRAMTLKLAKVTNTAANSKFEHEKIGEETTPPLPVVDEEQSQFIKGVYRVPNFLNRKDGYAFKYLRNKGVAGAEEIDEDIAGKEGDEDTEIETDKDEYAHLPLLELVENRQQLKEMGYTVLLLNESERKLLEREVTNELLDEFAAKNDFAGGAFVTERAATCLVSCTSQAQKRPKENKLMMDPLKKVMRDSFERLTECEGQTPPSTEGEFINLTIIRSTDDNSNLATKYHCDFPERFKDAELRRGSSKNHWVMQTKKAHCTILTLGEGMVMTVMPNGWTKRADARILYMPPYSAFFFHGMQPHAGHSYNSRTPIFENMKLFAEAIHSRKCAEEEREEKVPITPENAVARLPTPPLQEYALASVKGHSEPVPVHHYRVHCFFTEVGGLPQNRKILTVPIYDEDSDEKSMAQIAKFKKEHHMI